ncbi:hypothetical protein L3X38_035088 [Prunus dulcis]|uniref:Uncharacterized protein n=1 Tax=Prunus dulcis TaxID=3755 RepID=A0AAD4VKI5_PRUDU|nr:hypothetical protein L3X38_035088 [Prunus dulcis]
MVEAYKGKDADADSFDDTDSSSEEEVPALAAEATIAKGSKVIKDVEDVVRHVGALISTGTTASVPKDRENGVLPVDLWYDVLMAHNAYRSISRQPPLATLSFFFSILLMILLMASTCPLDCGCAGYANKMLMLNRKHKCRKRE